MTESKCSYITFPSGPDTSAPADHRAEKITAAKTAALTELQRGDAKAAHMLGFFGAVFGGVIALSRTGVSTGAEVLLFLAALPTAAAVGCLLMVLCPRLSRGGQTGITHWSGYEATPHDLVADLDRPGDQCLDDEAHHLAVLSRLAIDKYRHIQRAVFLLPLGVALACLALLAA